MRAGPVIIGYDGTPPAEQALREAADLLAPRRVLVVVVWEAGRAFELAEMPIRVLEAPPTALDVRTAFEVDKAMYEAGEQLAANGAALAKDLGLDAEGLAVADDITVADTLVRLAREFDAAAAPAAVGRWGAAGRPAGRSRCGRWRRRPGPRRSARTRRSPGRNRPACRSASPAPRGRPCRRCPRSPPGRRAARPGCRTGTRRPWPCARRSRDGVACRPPVGPGSRPPLHGTARSGSKFLVSDGELRLGAGGTGNRHQDGPTRSEDTMGLLKGAIKAGIAMKVLEIIQREARKP